MSKKSERLATIRNIIETQAIASQEDLLERLTQMGIPATQSTLSRDIKELKAVKIANGAGGYSYVMPETIQAEQPGDKMSSLLTDNILGIYFSGNLAVLKTKPGYANAAAVVIDNGHCDGLIGTIAGDDNIIMVMREDTSRQQLVEELMRMIPGLTLTYKEQ